MITVSVCPDAVAGLDVAFYKEIGCNAYELPLQPVRRWAVAPRLYIRSIDEAGAAVDAATLDTVQNTMIDMAPRLTAGKLSISVERGGATREGQTGWLTVKFPITTAADAICGRSQVAVDGGWIEINYKAPRCLWSGAIPPNTPGHELGHALGYWHTDNPHDLMSGGTAGLFYDASLSARELQAIAYHYR